LQVLAVSGAMAEEGLRKGLTMASVQAGAGEALAEDRPARVLVGVVRVVVGLLWVQNLSWKAPKGPDFGGLHQWVLNGVKYQVFAPYSWLLKHLVLTHFTFFGWMTLLVEGALGAFLLMGLATRFWALVGLAQTIAIALSAMNTPGEWFWSYFLMFTAHLALLATAAGRAYGLDGLLRPQWRARPGLWSRLLLLAS
jgi:thiosulfate dehydrogenase (quinone) large subunit